VTYEQILTPWHITFLHHQLTIKRIHSSTVQSEIGTVLLTMLSIQYSLNNSGVMHLYKLYLRYSTGCGERESRSFREEPETFISILISTSLYTYAPGAICYALSTAGTSAASGHSGVFNLLKFDRIWKKERKDMYCG